MFLSDYEGYEELDNVLNDKCIRYDYDVDADNDDDKLYLLLSRIMIDIHNDEQLAKYFANFLIKNKEKIANKLVLSLCYYYGYGVTKNCDMTFQLLEQCAKDNTHALLNLAKCYDIGIGCNVNMEKAKRLYQKSIDKGNTDAIFNLGLCYIDEHENDKAINMLKMAVDRGHSEAQCLLGEYYYEGIIVDKNQELAMELLKKSSDQGLSKAQYKLALKYRFNEDVKDIVKAYELFYISSDECGDSRINLDMIDRELIRMYENKKVNIDELIGIYQITFNDNLRYEIKKKVIEMEMFIMKLLVKTNLPYKPCLIINQYLYQLDIVMEEVD